MESRGPLPTRPATRPARARGGRFGPVTWAVAVCLAVAPTACGADREAPDALEPDWVALFNGTDLGGWTPKIRGQPAGTDPYGTFRVEDGLLTVGYDGYDAPFDDRFGHLFLDRPLSSYRLRVEYRFVGEQAEGGADWAFRNSGVMLHAQAPGSMGIDQDFPISVEVQLLGGDGSGARPTANVCTPGTHVVIAGALVERHCTSSSSRTYDGDGWVTVDIVVRDDGSIVHVMEGDTVLAYGGAVVGGGSVAGHDPAAKSDGEPLTRGWIALQSESHPVQFRSILVQEPPSGG